MPTLCVTAACSDIVGNHGTLCATYHKLGKLCADLYQVAQFTDTVGRRLDRHTV